MKKPGKTEMVARVARDCDMPEAAALRAVDAMLVAIQSTLARGEDVRIGGFGCFEVRVRAARAGRNPRTGEPVRIAERKVVCFRPGSAFRRAVDTAGGG